MEPMDNTELNGSLLNGNCHGLPHLKANNSHSCTDCSYKTRDVEMFRLIGQYLYDRGLKDAYNLLVTESGISLEGVLATRLRQAVLEGQWDTAELAVDALLDVVTSSADRDEMRFLILEQRFLEHLEENEVMPAVTLLRHRITPMRRNTERVHALASCLMCRTGSELRTQAGAWRGRAGGSRSALIERLQAYIPASVMLPPRRLDQLVDDAVRYQLTTCSYHNCPDDLQVVSLLQKHDCNQRDFPLVCSQLVRQRDTELCQCLFSPNGVYLATAGKDENVDLWQVNAGSHTVTFFNVIATPPGVSYLAWSPDSNKLAICCGEEHGGVLVHDMTSCSQLCSIRIHDDDTYTAAAFLNDNKKLAIGGLKGTIYIVDTENNSRILTQVEGYRVTGIVCVPPSTTTAAENGRDLLIIADTLQRVRLYQFAVSSTPVSANASPAVSAVAATIGGSGSQSGAGEGSSSGTSTPTFAHSQALHHALAVSDSPAQLLLHHHHPLFAHHHHHPGSGSAASYSYSIAAATVAVASAVVPTVMALAASSSAVGGGHSPSALLAAAQVVGSGDGQQRSGLAVPVYQLVEHCTLFKEAHLIHAIRISSNGKLILVTLQKQGLHLWDIGAGAIIQRYVGMKQESLHMHATFGGHGEKFVACGSEDGHVHVWQRSSDRPIHSCAGHNGHGPVTAVHWNPTLHTMLAAVNDDGELTIWAPRREL